MVCFYNSQICGANECYLDGHGSQVPYQGLSYSDTILRNRQRRCERVGHAQVSNFTVEYTCQMVKFSGLMLE